VRSHWYLVVAGLVATAALCVVATTVVPAKYEATARVYLYQKAANPGDNALLGIAGLQPLADTLSLAMTDSSVQDDLFRAGARGDYQVQLDPLAKGPVLQVTATDLTPAASMSTLRVVIAEIQKVLTNLQDEHAVPQKARVDSGVLAQDRTGTLVLKSRVRLLGAVIGLGLALTFGGIVFLDSRAQQRAGSWSRRAPRRARAPSGAAATNGAKAANGRSVTAINGTAWAPVHHSPLAGSADVVGNGAGPGVEEETVRLSRES
jgi:hypothetical protein